MSNTLAVLVSIIFFALSSTNALYFPQAHLESSAQSTSPALADKCTFTLWHKQLCRNSVKSDYIQINELQDHTNNIVIDIAALRPIAARNSYSKISATHAFAIEGLLGNERLTIREGRDSDELEFEYDGVRFSSDRYKNSKEAWCVSGAWDVNDWQCGPNSRERKIQCAFPCGSMEEDDSNDDVEPTYNDELR